MASIIAGGEPEEYYGENPENLLKMLFIAILLNHPSEISSEFSRYLAETKVIEKKD